MSQMRSIKTLSSFMMAIYAPLGLYMSAKGDLPLPSGYETRLPSEFAGSSLR